MRTRNELAFFALALAGLAFRASAAVTYSLLNSGRCADVALRVPLFNADECRAAMSSLALSTAVPINLRLNDNYPPGCWHKSSKLYLNGNARAVAVACGVSSRQCICASAPACTNTSGYQNNADDCVCGSVACTGFTGRFCTATISRCSAYAACENRNSTAENTLPCGCGAVDCTSGTGLFCHADAARSRCASAGPIRFCESADGSTPNSNAASASCACGTSNCDASTGMYCHESSSTCSPSEIKYALVQTGACDDVPGLYPIFDFDECDAGAEALGLSDTFSSADTAISSINPTGCYLEGTSSLSLKVNSEPKLVSGESVLGAGQNVGACSSGDKCVCRLYPPCENQNGTVKNARDCYCGSTDTTLCCSGSCKGSQVGVGSGLYCYGHYPFCSPRPTGLRLVSSGRCDSSDSSSEPLHGAEVCEMAARSFGLVGGTGQNASTTSEARSGAVFPNWRNDRPPFCYYSAVSQRVYLNLYGLAPYALFRREQCRENKDCDQDARAADCSSERPCLCAAAHSCKTTNQGHEGAGEFANRPLGMCRCGTHGIDLGRTLLCTEETGFVCTTKGSLGATMSHCTHGPPCHNQNGTARNEGPWCTCGDGRIDRSTNPEYIHKEECSASTGMFCATKNATARLAQLKPGRTWKESRVVVGRCSTEPGMLFCRVTDGSAPNLAAASCLCGLSTCDDMTGRYCHEQSSSCSQRPIDYELVAMRSCTPGTEITSENQCAAAANLLNVTTAAATRVVQIWNVSELFDIHDRSRKASSNNSFDSNVVSGYEASLEALQFTPSERHRNTEARKQNVLGCTYVVGTSSSPRLLVSDADFRMAYYHEVTGVLSTLPQPVRSECAADKVCLCRVARPCSYVNGSRSNAMACLCGATQCSTKTGLVCFERWSACSKFPRCDVFFGNRMRHDVRNESAPLELRSSCTMTRVFTVQSMGARLHVNGSYNTSHGNPGDGNMSDTLATMDGASRFQIFRVIDGAKLVLERVQLQHGARDRLGECSGISQLYMPTRIDAPDSSYQRCFGSLLYVQDGASVEIRHSVLKDDYYSPTVTIEKAVAGIVVNVRPAKDLAMKMQAGGGVYIGRNSTLFAEHVQFIGLQAGLGGAMYFDRSLESVIRDSTFSNCGATQGGAIGMGRAAASRSTLSGLIVHVIGVIFHKCHSTYYGGGIAAFGGHLRVEQSEFVICSANVLLRHGAGGAGIACLRDYEKEFTHYDDAIGYLTGKPKYPSIAKCVVKDTLLLRGYSRYGGGAFAEDIDDFYVSGSTFSQNIAVNAGGGVFIKTSINGRKFHSTDGRLPQIFLENSRIFGNTAGLTSRCRTASGADIERNEEAIHTSLPGNGGGLCVSRAESIDSLSGDSSFSGDKFVNMTISGSFVEQNHATSQGGGLYIDTTRYPDRGHFAGSAVLLAGSIIRKNRAKFGGGAYVSTAASLTLLGGSEYWQMEALAKTNKIVENVAEKFGGGFFFADRAIFDVTRDHTFLVTGNTAAESGGGIYVGCAQFFCGFESKVVRPETRDYDECVDAAKKQGVCFSEVFDKCEGFQGPSTKIKVDAPGRIEENKALAGSEIEQDIFVPTSSILQPQLACAQGMFQTSTSTGRAFCAACPIGYNQRDYGQNLCSLCDIGKYSNENGTVECMSCAPGQFQSSLGATRCNVCEREGEIPNDGRTDCEKPTWRIKSDCSHTQFLNDSSENKTDYECVACPAGASCVGDINATGIRTLFGWSRCPAQKRVASSSVGLIFERCQFMGSCLGQRNEQLQGRFVFNGTDPAMCQAPDRDSNIASVHACKQGCNVHAGYRKDGRQCAACKSGFSHGDLSGRCDKCPDASANLGLAVVGGVVGIVGVVVLVQITLGDSEAISLGNVDSADAIKAICLSFIQVFTLLVTFPIQWPEVFTFLFQVGGTITVMGEHLVNLKCFFIDKTEAEVFFLMRIVWAVVPVCLLMMCVCTWMVVHRVRPVEDLRVKIRISCVALLYLIWPSLCTNTFALFACRTVCDTSYMKIDINVPCLSGQHAMYSAALGVPMMLLYVGGLPIGALVALKRMVSMKSVVKKNDAGATKALHEQHRIWGMFSAFYSDETWFWEGIVALRKIVIAMIGVFGSSMGNMQIHVTSMVMVASLTVTAFMRPYRGPYKSMLQRLEMMSLGGIWLTLWGATIFNEYPKCQAAVGDAGFQLLLWCQILSVSIGFLDVLFVAGCVVCFLAVKRSQGKVAKQRRLMKDADNAEFAAAAAAAVVKHAEAGGEGVPERGEEEGTEGKMTGEVELVGMNVASPIRSDRLWRLEQQQARRGTHRPQHGADWNENPFFRNM